MNPETAKKNNMYEMGFMGHGGGDFVPGSSRQNSPVRAELSPPTTATLWPVDVLHTYGIG